MIFEDQELPSAPEVQPQGQVTHAEFCETICQVTTHQLVRRVNKQKIVDTSTIREFFGMKRPSFTGSSVTEDPVKFC